ncbi:uncharacterized protein LOC131604383 [Vicia villosa]|uniref:uncharacterized protein LOC131604383 n=1 Tax=Vicia villosa TaxID=3911 RepID=UPI00273C1FFA|nr:uncharacterized protein LOC131604383 [Vicia villosa]
MADVFDWEDDGIVWNSALLFGPEFGEVPPRIKVFTWRFIIDRLPTKYLLIMRGFDNISQSPLCEFCRNYTESINHMFYLCNVSKVLWERIFVWLGDDLPFTLEEFQNFGVIQEKVKNAKDRRKINMVWIATTWSLWIMRNAMIFDLVYSNIMYLS